MAGGGRGTVTGSGNLDRAAAPHREAFLRHLDEAFRRYGYAEGLPERLRAAVRATPRHRFVHRFRAGADGPLQDFDADPVGLLPLVYRGQPLTPVDGAGAPLPSTNSEAAYMLWLVARLGVEPGQRVLEIGCGSGWLLAVMAHLAGPGGRTTGVEIIPDLADQARADLAGLGCADAAVLTGDATRAPIPGGPFDRVIVTAATWDIPAALFDCVAAGGRLLVPLRLPRDEGCEVTLLRRAGPGFSALWSVPGFFVPLVGAGQSAEIARLSREALPLRDGTGIAPSLSCPLWFGGLAPAQPAAAAQAFRRYLALTEPSFAVFEPAASPAPPRWVSDFGLVDRDGGSAAIVGAGRLTGYGTPAAARRLARAYRGWCDLGMPGPSAFALDILPAAAVAASPTALTELRGHTALVRTLDPQAGALRGLLDGGSGRRA